MMRRVTAASAAMALCAMSAAAWADATATLDRDSVAPGDTVQLTLQREGRGGGDPDLAPLAADFDVLSRSTAENMQLVNGHFSVQRQVQLTLAPKRDGRLTIPAIRWAGDATQPLALQVGGGQGAQGGAGNAAATTQHVYFTATLDSPHPYVQSAVVYTVRLHADQALLHASLDLAANGDVLVQQLGKDRQTTETIDGRSYQVVERRYVLLPQKSGTLTLDGPVLDAQVADPRDPFFGRAFGNLPGAFGVTRPLRLRGDPIALDVRARPAGAADHDWLPAQAVTLQETWQPANAKVRVGEPLTRHVSLEAVGATGAQLPDLAAAMPLPDGVKAYPDQAKLDDVERAGTLVGRRDQDVALIASRAGGITLPPLRVVWWDTVHDAPREAVLPQRVIDVLPAATPVTTPPSTSAPAPATVAVQAPAGKPHAVAAPSNVWPWVSLALGVLWLLTLGFALRRRQAVPAAPAASLAQPLAAAADRAAVRQAAGAGDARATRGALLGWAASLWPQDPPRGLHALARRAGDPELAAALHDLDRALSLAEPWDGAQLARALDAWQAPDGRPAESDPLGSLYA